MACHSMVRVKHDMVWYGMAWHGRNMEWHGMVVLWYGMV